MRTGSVIEILDFNTTFQRGLASRYIASPSYGTCILVCFWIEYPPFGVLEGLVWELFPVVVIRSES